MAHKGYSVKQHRQGGGWKGYEYRRAKSPGNTKAIMGFAMLVKEKCTGAKGKGAAKACLLKTNPSRSRSK